MSTILDWLTPWWAKLAVLAVLLSGLLWLKHTYDTGVAKKAVESALVKERAVEAPKLKAAQLALAEIKAASEAEAIKRKAELNVKTKEYQNAIAQTQLLKAELAAKRSSDADFERLLNTLANTGDSASGTGISTRYDRLKTAYQQCERDTREALDTAASTIERLGEAIAAIDALKLK